MITPDPKIPRRRGLAGKAIFLSASVPSKERSEIFRRETDTAVTIEEAVVAVARAVFAAGGKLVFGAHPSISPLVASVLGEYSIPEAPPADEKREPRQWREGECQPCVEMYQSKVWEPLWAEASRRLAERPHVGIRWVPAIGGESVSAKPSAKPQAPRSLKEMRMHMIRATNPVAMIAIGGMEGTQEEAELFAELRPGHPIYALSTTGGAARLIAERLHIRDNRVIVLDEKARDDVMSFWRKQENRAPVGRKSMTSARVLRLPHCARDIITCLIHSSRNRLLQKLKS